MAPPNVTINNILDRVRKVDEAIDPVTIPLHGGKLHPGWEVSEMRGDGCLWINRPRGMRVICSIAREADGKRWLHVSLSRPSTMPRYEDLTYVKRQFLGDDFKAVMVFPEKRYHVNIHQYCLHLFHCLEPGGDSLPEFSLDGASI